MLCLHRAWGRLPAHMGMFACHLTPAWPLLSLLLCCHPLPCAWQAKENLELRMKYAEEPMKFLENEVDLLSLIRGLAQVRRTAVQMALPCARAAEALPRWRQAARQRGSKTRRRCATSRS